MQSSTSRGWLEGAIAAAFAMALSFIPLKFGPGFSISIGMLPIIVYSLRRGFKPGLYSGLIWGLLHFLLGKAYILTVSQALIEYLLAYTFIGFAGLFHVQLQKELRSKSGKVWLTLLMGTVVGTLARYVCHFLAGVIFWGKYALWGLSPVTYSLVINGTSAVLTSLATYAIVLLLAKKSPKIFIP
ncbi:energy-coupled thiamine transporter ThiT [Vagococcus hydrophili]|uniref:Energy-coupled thiamine transporter ThiT n=1 Tax=Vagococcus hydrophili TaxID=2714947 RepID=A0A6G8AS37_9ENTE|nr:energy-coupled thiamine transporter ThiT [Vagococcus hydrophili]QIL47743.1 energy-coupled thiamine transporter ThiT [Vagococcus hydrophili]